MVALPDNEKSMRICLLISIQYTKVTDGRTDTAHQHRPHYAQRHAAIN